MGVTRTTKATTRARYPKPILTALAVIAAFMNAIGPRTTPRQWDAFRRKLSPYYVTSGPWMSLEEAKTIRRDLNCDLEFLRADTPIDRPFDNLIDRLNELHLPTAWECEPLPQYAKPRNPSQAIIELRWKDGTTGRWTAQSRRVAKTLRDWFYMMLGAAFERGQLAKLRICRHCGKYLAAVRGKRREVCPGCKDPYQNQKKTEKGYWKQNRKDHRAMQERKARRLKQSGASPKKIQKETGLPPRVVRKVVEEK